MYFDSKSSWFVIWQNNIYSFVLWSSVPRAFQLLQCLHPEIYLVPCPGCQEEKLQLSHTVPHPWIKSSLTCWGSSLLNLAKCQRKKYEILSVSFLQRNLKVKQVVGQLGNIKISFSQLSLRSCKHDCFGIDVAALIFHLQPHGSVGCWGLIFLWGVEVSSASPGALNRHLLLTPSCKLSAHQQEPEICAFRLQGVWDGCGVQHEKHVHWHRGEGFSFIFQMLCVDGKVKNASSTNTCLWQDGVSMKI